MATLVVDTTSYQFNGASDSRTTSGFSVSGSDTLLLVVLGQSFNVAATGVTWNGAALTQLDEQDRENAAGIELWYLKNPDAGEQALAITFPSGRRIAVGVAVLSGVHQTTTFGTVGKASGTSGTAAATVSSASGELVIGAAAVDEGVDVTADGGQTPRWNQKTEAATAADVTNAGSTKAGDTSVTLTWTSAIQEWVALAVPLKPAAAAAAPVNTVAPALSGTAQVGQALSCTEGTWDNDPDSFTYQWQDSADGSTGWANISGATSSSYSIQAADEGNFLKCVVTATNETGSNSADSNVSGAVAAAAETTGHANMMMMGCG